MSGDDVTRGPVRTRAFLIDPESMTVAWMNEPAASDHPESATPGEVRLDRLAPVDGLPEALREVAATGVPRHVSTALVSTHRGAMSVVVSVYRLPDGMLLVLSDSTFRLGRASRDDDAGTPPPRRRR